MKSTSDTLSSPEFADNSSQGGNKTIFEPFRIKSIEPIRLSNFEQRQSYLQRAHYNLFALHSDDVMIDLLTDSGTSAMSAAQWSCLMKGDESYAGSPSFDRFEKTVQSLMSFRHIIPTHQGRAAEAILFSVLFSGRDRRGAGLVIPSNTHFDTTRGNIEATGCEALDLVISEGKDPQLDYPFKGNLDISELQKLLEERGESVPLIMVTITNNAGGGQPVSLANIRSISKLAKHYGKLFFIDGCRFAENAYFIKLREEGQQQRSIRDIVQEIFSLCDGMTMSAKKDAFANIGGWLAVNDDDLAQRARNRLILTEGFPTYGGLAGRDLEAIAQGLNEIIDEDYLRYRIRSNAYIGERLEKMGYAIIKPTGGHAVFIDARKTLPHIPPLKYPGHALAVALYEQGGVRSCEIGSVMFGRRPDGSEKAADLELVRLAMPRRVYTQSHADYLLEVCESVLVNKSKIPGYRITWEPPALRHFTAQFDPIVD